MVTYLDVADAYAADAVAADADAADDYAADGDADAANAADAADGDAAATVQVLTTRMIGSFVKNNSLCDAFIYSLFCTLTTPSSEKQCRLRCCLH